MLIRAPAVARPGGLAFLWLPEIAAPYQNGSQEEQ